jgi:large subunit ribosomal protein L15
LTVINFETLLSHGLASKNDKIKILGGGQLTSKIDVSAHKFSASAIAAVEGLGGTVTQL